MKTFAGIKWNQLGQDRVNDITEGGLHPAVDIEPADDDDNNLVFQTSTTKFITSGAVPHLAQHWKYSGYFFIRKHMQHRMLALCFQRTRITSTKRSPCTYNMNALAMINELALANK